MIRIDSITIEEFRGIRDLTLDFKEKNFAICGPNGTGKSGVVNALEFVLTGNVSRLSGEGRGDISLKKHGPHVDRRNDPEKTRVKAKIAIPSLNKSFTVERNLKTPAAALVNPRDPEVLEVLRLVEGHPEIVLSRRELIRYVLATPGKRAEEVQALLHLDQVEQVRSGLQKIANSCEKQLISLGTSVKQTSENLLRVLGISELTKDKVLAAVNAQRVILGLPKLVDVTASTSFRDGMETSGQVRPQSIPKTQAIADIGSAREALAEVTSASTARLIADVLPEIRDLADDPTIAGGVKREFFYKTGIELIETTACPFCDTQWEISEIKKYVQAKIDQLEEVSLKRKQAEKKLVPLIEILGKVQARIKTLVGYAALATPPINVEAARGYGADCEKGVESLTALLPILGTITVLNNLPILPQSVTETISELDKVVAALPEPTKQDVARELLAVAQERFEVWREARRKQKVATEQAQRARKVSDIYAMTSDTVLAGLYKAVEKDFESLYGFVNRDDEGEFKAQLIPSLGKLGFDVDFYGRGFFPPGAYHSEGHQDGMGLCLYLALMRYIQGAAFTFAVLDDVLMSVDAGHRREVCDLLKKEFPNTQFIMTTHDPVWLRHMQTERLIEGRSAVQFKSWDVDHGPIRWDDRDVWTEIEDHLKQNEVRAAAGLLRHYLEYASAELCHRLRAPVEYRGDGRYQLGDLLPPAIGKMRKIYSKAKDVAYSWNQKDVMENIAARASKFGRLADLSNAEKWQVNVAVHYNSWENLGKEDFEPVVKALHELLEEFTCSDCSEYLRVLPEREAPESLRCECGKTNINLHKKEGS